MTRKPPWLVIDVSNIAWAAWHTTGDLSHEGVGTGVLFGVLRKLKLLMTSYATTKVAFCFDRPPYKRNKLYPGYKRKIRLVEPDNPHESAREEVYRQIDKLRTSYLERLGFNNVFYQKGYEADDMIASVIRCLPDAERAVIVSSDTDLYQLLSPRVQIHRTRTNGEQGNITHMWLKREHLVTPDQWVQVKAIAGCAGDNVPHPSGVGITSAAAFANGRKVNERIANAIEEWIACKQYQTNLTLVKLPYPGCNKCPCHEDELDTRKWDKLMKELGMKSLKTGDF